MRDFSRIYAAYLEADGAFAARLAAARTPRGRDRWERLQQINDYAYFALLFAQLEDRVNREAAALVARKRGARRWRRRRLWDGVDPANLSFMNRVALLVDRGSHAYRDIKDNYELRNRIDHGDTTVSGIVVPNKALILRGLARALRA